MSTHQLKTWPRFLDAVVEGRKTFEVRRNDRGFQVGDTLILTEFDPDTGLEGSRRVTVKVTYMMEGPDPWGAVAAGFVVLGFAEFQDEGAHRNGVEPEPEVGMDPSSVHVVWIRDRSDPEWGPGQVQMVCQTKGGADQCATRIQGGLVSTLEDYLIDEAGKAHQRGIWACQESHSLS